MWPAPAGPCAVAVAFRGYSAVAADAPAAWVREHVPAGPQGALAPTFLAALAGRLHAPAPGVHLLLAARRPPQAEARATLLPSSEMPADWAAHRSDVACWTDAEGASVIAIGRGPGGRYDLYAEVCGAENPWLRPETVARIRGVFDAARALAPDDLFASVPVQDAMALRAHLLGGFRAIGAEALFRTRPAPTWFPSYPRARRAGRVGHTPSGAGPDGRGTPEEDGS